jgi:hypothetical protein
MPSFTTDTSTNAVISRFGGFTIRLCLHEQIKLIECFLNARLAIIPDCFLNRFHGILTS